MEGYNIKVNVDSRSAERGVKGFTSALNDSLKQLRDFDNRARSAFNALNSFSKLNVGNLTKSVNQVSAAVKALNQIKVNTKVTDNLQAMARALNGIKFNGAASLKTLPGALRDLSKIKIDQNLVNHLNGLKSAMKGFSAPPASLAQWPKALSAFGKVKLSPSLAKQVEALKLAMRGFAGPGKSAMAMPAFLRGLSNAKINPSIANNLAKLKSVFSGFAGPSAAAARNLTAFLNAFKGASGAQINKIANALAKMNGLNMRISASSGRAGQGLSNMGKSSAAASHAMEKLYQSSLALHNALMLVQSVLGGMTVTGFAKSIYEVGSAYQSLQRTLTAVATSPEEVASHLQFLQDLTTRMPISIEVATESFKKFAAATRLSGVSAKDTQEVFEAFSMGFAAMGVNAEHSRHAFMALEQIFSKGTVTSEELKQQLGEHLPGAVSILADALGITTAEMFKIMEQGKLTSDSILKMSKGLKEKFAASAAAAMNSAQGSITQMQNAWTTFQKTVFSNGFESGLGAMAKSLANLLKRDDMIQFAKDIGEAFNRLFRVISVGATVLADNKDTVISFLKAFAAWGAIAATGAALRMFIAPLMIIGPLAAGAATAFTGLRTAIAALSAANIIKTFGTIAKAFNTLAGKITMAAAGIVLFAAGMDAMFNNSKATDAIVGGMAKAFGTIGRILQEAMPKLEITSQIEDASATFDELDKKVQEATKSLNEMEGNQFEKNALDEQKRLDQKMKALTQEEQKLWDQVNSIGAANKEYQDQLELLDSIAKKRGMSAPELNMAKEVLAQQTLKDRDPIGAEVQDLQHQLDLAKAMTAETKAQVDAEKWRIQMLEKGVPVTDKMVEAMKEFNIGMAKMQGEAGNGFERWSASVKDWNESMQDAIATGIGDLSDELTNFVTGADYDFRKLAQSILRSFVKIGIDNLLKDMFTGMGQNGAVNGAKQAQDALSKLTAEGKTISAQQVTIYADAVNVPGSVADTPLRGSLDANGQSSGAPASALTPSPVGAVERKSLPPVDGAPVDPNYYDKPYRGFADAPLRGSFAVAGQPAAATAQKNKGVLIQPSDLTDGAINPGQNAIDRSSPSNPAAGVNRIPSLTEQAIVDGQKQAAAAPAAVPEAAAALPPAVVPASGKVLALSQQDIVDMKKTLATEWVPSAGEDQAKGIIDTMMNRQMSGRWGNDMASVVNARKQFSDVNGPVAWKAGRHSVDDLVPGQTLSQSAYNRSSSMVDKYLAERASGAPSIVDDHLNYANPTYSDARNLRWINKLDGPRLGTNSRNTHHHGTTDDLQKYRPGEYGVQLPGQTVADATTTGAVPDTTAIKDANAALNQAMPSFDKLKTTVTDTGTQAMTSSTQVQTGMQQQTMATQQNAMAMQQSSTSVQFAGTAAQQASPAFQQAGQSIQTAGQQAQMAGTQAAAANPGLSGMASGISGLLGPLSSAIPGLSTFTSVLGMLGGGGGITGGLFKEGGFSGSPVSSGTMPASAFANAPHYAEGTPNTSGGMPAILHPNEAVIPLTRGREVPVKIDSTAEDDYKTEYGQRQNVGAPVVQMVFNGVKNGDDFKRSKRQAQAMVASGMQESMRRNT